MTLSLHHSFYVILITISSSLGSMDFAGPANLQIDSTFSQLSLDIHIMVASYTNARTILNLQQTCRLWYYRLNSEAKKRIATIRNWPDAFHMNQEFYDVTLVATLANFTTPEQIPFCSKEPELFLLAGANPNYMHELNGKTYTSTSLFLNNSKYAYTDEIKKVLKALMHHGANVNLWKGEEYSVLHRAVRADATDMVAYLITQKADINQKDFEGNTALHHAATNLSYTMVKLLLENNAEVSLKNNNQKTAQQELCGVQLYDNQDVQTFFKIESLFDPSKKDVPAVQTIEYSQQ